MIAVQYIDDYFLICVKPVGIISESPGLPDMLSVQLNRKLYPVHRLDRGTGGVCVLALSAKACAGLQKLFLQDRIQKEYLAVVSGIPDSVQGTFRDLLYHDKKKNKLVEIQYHIFIVIYIYRTRNIYIIFQFLSHFRI